MIEGQPADSQMREAFVDVSSSHVSRVRRQSAAASHA